MSMRRGQTWSHLVRYGTPNRDIYRQKDTHRDKYDLKVRYSTLRTVTNSFTLRARIRTLIDKRTHHELSPYCQPPITGIWIYTFRVSLDTPHVLLNTLYASHPSHTIIPSWPILHHHTSVRPTPVNIDICHTNGKFITLSKDAMIESGLFAFASDLKYNKDLIVATCGNVLCCVKRNDNRVMLCHH